MVIRFKESVRVRVWGKEMSNFRKGDVHAVPTAVAGVLLAQGCAEPVGGFDTPRARARQLVRLSSRRSRSAIACSSMARCAGAHACWRVARARVRASISVARSARRRASSGLNRADGRRFGSGCLLLRFDRLTFPSSCHLLSSVLPFVVTRIAITWRVPPRVLRAARPSGRRGPTHGLHDRLGLGDGGCIAGSIHGVGLDEFFLRRRRRVDAVVDGGHRTRRDAGAAVDALIGMDVEHRAWSRTRVRLFAGGCSRRGRRRRRRCPSCQCTGR